VRTRQCILKIHKEKCVKIGREIRFLSMSEMLVGTSSKIRRENRLYRGRRDLPRAVKGVKIPFRKAPKPSTRPILKGKSSWIDTDLPLSVMRLIQVPETPRLTAKGNQLSRESSNSLMPQKVMKPSILKILRAKSSSISEVTQLQSMSEIPRPADPRRIRMACLSYLRGRSDLLKLAKGVKSPYRKALKPSTRPILKGKSSWIDTGLLLNVMRSILGPERPKLTAKGNLLSRESSSSFHLQKVMKPSILKILKVTRSKIDMATLSPLMSKTLVVSLNAIRMARRLSNARRNNHLTATAKRLFILLTLRVTSNRTNTAIPSNAIREILVATSRLTPEASP